MAATAAAAAPVGPARGGAAAINKQASFWDSRYGDPAEFAYGEAPNAFIAAAAARYLAAPCSVVELASGEGRNVAHLAEAGHYVTAVDFSQAGLDKTMALSQRLGAAARVTPVLADILTWAPPGGQQVDVVVLSFCHTKADERPGFMAHVRGMLHPGGVLLMEVFHPNQVHKGYRATSGGPQDPGMMVSLEEMRALLLPEAGEELEGAEVEYELAEGRFHAGLGAVTRYAWRKAQAAA